MLCQLSFAGKIFIAIPAPQGCLLGAVIRSTMPIQLVLAPKHGVTFHTEKLPGVILVVMVVEGAAVLEDPSTELTLAVQGIGEEPELAGSRTEPGLGLERGGTWTEIQNVFTSIIQDLKHLQRHIM